jgi:hypothetical protein
MPSKILDAVPVWLMFLLTLAFVFAAVEIGFRAGAARRRRTEDVKEAAVGSMVGATIGLLAFMLAFTFGMAASRHDARRALVLDEANALHTAYLRAALLPQAHRAEVRSLLRQYLETRLAWDGPTEIPGAIASSEELQQRLWSRAEAAGGEEPTSIGVGLFVRTLNEAIDLHGKRVRAGLWSRVPSAIFFVLFFVMALAMLSMGFLAGIAGRRIRLVTIALALAFSSVLLLIVDLDRPREGFLTVSQQPLLELRARMIEPP